MGEAEWTIDEVYSTLSDKKKMDWARHLAYQHNVTSSQAKKFLDKNPTISRRDTSASHLDAQQWKDIYKRIIEANRR